MLAPAIVTIICGAAWQTPGSTLRGPSRLARGAVIVMDERWPDIVRSYVSNKFKSIDLDSSGEVDKEELASLYRSMMPNASEDDISQCLSEFFANFDADESGDIDEQEFRTAVLSNQLLNSDMRLKEQVFVDVLQSFKADGERLLSTQALGSLEAQLDWEGSNVPDEYAALVKNFLA